MSINSLEIFAELSKRQYKKLIDGDVEIEVPHGVSMNNRRGSRGLMFDCEDHEAATELIEGLENSALNWQMNLIEVDENPHTEDETKFIKEMSKEML